MRTGRRRLALLLGAALMAGQAAVAEAPVWGPDLTDLRPIRRPEPMAVRTPTAADPRPEARSGHLPRARWENRRRGTLWTRVAMSSVMAHGRPLIATVPDDIDDWCPAYPDQTDENRAAFWVALLSTLTRYESTWRPQAVGGGGLWYGLAQILPTTAELRKCRVTTGEELKHGPSNLSCAIRIMANTVPRDNAISIRGKRRWQGVAADWGPMTTTWMREDMQRYTRKQTYCRLLETVRPKRRPGDAERLAAGRS